MGQVAAEETEASLHHMNAPCKDSEMGQNWRFLADQRRIQVFFPIALLRSLSTVSLQKKEKNHLQSSSMYNFKKGVMP